MSKLIDLTNKTFGFWRVIERDLSSTSTGQSAKWKCLCTSCGKIYSVSSSSLINGKSTKCRSCGNSGRNPYPQELRFVFKGMCQRCYNPNSSSYARYGAKGTTICDEWLNDRKLFYKWAVENGYKKGLTIDRIDGELGYSPTNCHWITVEENNRNRKCVTFLTYNGKTQTASQWSRELNIPLSTIMYRYKKGWDIDKILCIL